MYSTTLELLKTITNYGFLAYAVGGFPRNKYLKISSTDVDICTNATPKDLKNIFNSKKFEILNYGVVKLTYHKIKFEIATFRKEIGYKDNRKPIKVEYIDNLAEDLDRRDFVINTLCIDKDGNYVDLLDARQDIDKRIIRMIDNPKKRLEEDSLRILRALRFATVLDFNLEENLKQAILSTKYLLKNLSYERKKQELDLIFVSKNNKKGIKLLKELKIDQELEINLDNIVVTPSSLAIWAQLNVLDKYPFTANEKSQIKKIIEVQDKDLLNKTTLYKYGLYICTLSGEIRNISRKDITVAFDNLLIKNTEDINISATKICTLLNKKPDKFLKRIMTDLEQKILNGNLKNTENDIIIYITKKYL